MAESSEQGEQFEKQKEQQEADQQKFRAHLLVKWTKSHSCPICGINDWGYGNRAEVRLADRVDFGKVYPAFPAICNNCGYMLWFNAIVVGVAKDPPEDE